MIPNTIKTLAEISSMQKDHSEWKLTNTGRCFSEWTRVVNCLDEPTQTFVDVCYQSAPLHNFRSRKLIFEESSGVWILTLWATLDTSD